MACPPGTRQEDINAYVTATLQPGHIAAMLEDTSYRCWVVESDSKVQGIAMLDLHPEPIGVEAADAAQAAELKRCYIYPALHGTGAASALVEQAIASYHGAFRLTVADQNLRAQAFYKKHGFVVVGETQFLCGTDVHRDLVMLRLPPKQ
nr:GNAT family N-acetyltransferase [Pseudomonas oryzihabitans]